MVVTGTELAMKRGATIGEVFDEKQAVIDRLTAENARLRNALMEYGHHKTGCKIDPCDCGILALLRLP